MFPGTASAIAHPNIAMIKYWGDREPVLHIPANGSISMNLAELSTQTTVRFDEHMPGDLFLLNGHPIRGTSLERVSKLLDQLRQLAGIDIHARVESENNFPISAGIASSAAGFAALSLAASKAAGLNLSEKELSRLARIGSGSACRSIPGGFVEWQAGHDDQDSYAYSIAPVEHWNLVDCVAIVNTDEKPISSQIGHTLANTSPLQPSRVDDTARRLALCRAAIRERDFEKLAYVTELDSNLMHAVMMTSTPSIFYWKPATLAIIHAVRSWRDEGIPVCYTIDAGPNVHILCPGEHAANVKQRLIMMPEAEQVIPASPGGPAHLVDAPLAR